MDVFRKKARFIPGTLLVCGTCVGAGMLGIPVVTGPAGWIPALSVNAATFLLMLLTGLLFMEATLWMPDQSNLISISNKILGKWGKWISGFFFLFLYYCLMVAYVSGGAPLLEGFPYPYILFSTFFGLMIFFGARFVGRVNTLLMVGFVISYLLLIGAATPQIHTQYLMRSNFWLSLFAAPTLMSAFGFHNIIPTLSTYLSRDRKLITITIISGATLSFIIYSLWLWVILGSIPESALNEAVENGTPITQTLQSMTSNTWISTLSLAFAFFALVTSLLGVSLSMCDFLADALSWKRDGFRRFILCVIIFVPPTILAKLYPHIFMDALGIAGGIGEAILNSLIPIALIWVGKYNKKLKISNHWLTSKSVLSLLALITLSIMGIELYLLIST
ncbi:hypothetical protein N9Y92_04015 [Chlamydiales bacterium]|nr:hypothetical protein [Chlamydiales bacterium]